MPRTCTICRHGERPEIEALLVEGRVPLREMARTFSSSPSALARHKAHHLPGVLVDAVRNDETARGKSLLAYVRDLQMRATTLLDGAEKSGDPRTALAAMRELRGILGLFGQVASREQDMLEISVVERYVEKIFDILHEFVPDDRFAAAVTKLKDFLEAEASGLDPNLELEARAAPEHRVL